MEAFLTGKTYELANEPAQTALTPPVIKVDVPTVVAAEFEPSVTTFSVAPTTSSRAQALLDRVKAQRAGK